jgi:hypothetical protein
MYSFQREGEFIQLTVEDAGRVTGFVSRFGDSEGDRGAFLDQFFKTGKLDGTKLTFTTDIGHSRARRRQNSSQRGLLRHEGHTDRKPHRCRQENHIKVP